jgi:hypothetical protein
MYQWIDGGMVENVDTVLLLLLLVLLLVLL